jgi:hypothetical protein
MHGAALRERQQLLGSGEAGRRIMKVLVEDLRLDLPL